MSTAFSPLDDIRVASPCRASWEAMIGDDQARFCQTCHKNVFNISMMTRAEAEALIREKEGNLCVRFARRADGTLVTGDCPVSVRKRQQTHVICAMVAALIVILSPSVVGRSFRRATAWTFRQIPALAVLEETEKGRHVFAWLDTPEPRPLPMIMGAYAGQMNQ